MQVSLHTPSLDFAYAATKEAIIVGGGLSGLTAAFRLEQAGYDIKLLEARERAGGRVITVPCGTGTEELGGRFIEDGGDAHAMRALIKELELEIDTYKIDYTKMYLSEEDGKIHEYYPFFEKCLPQDKSDEGLIEDKSKQVKSLGELLDWLFLDKPELRALVEARMRNYEGSDTKDLSSSYYESLLTYIDDIHELSEDPICETSSVRGGNSRLVEALERKLQGKIVYQAVLKKISKAAQEKIRLEFDGHPPIVTRKVVLAIPCSTLRDVEIEEGLIPADQLQAIQTMQYGTNAKIFLPVHEISEKEKYFANTQHLQTYWNKDCTVMTLFYGGSEGDFDSVEKKKEKDLPEIKKMYPSIQLSEEKPIGISWSKERFSKGSYSNIGVDQDELFSPVEEIAGCKMKRVFRPINMCIYFAGEHTVPVDEYPGTMEAAIASGNVAARCLSSISPCKAK